MALDDAKLTELARALGRRVFVQAERTAHTDTAALKAVINRLDQIFSATTNQIATLRPNTVLKTAILNEIKVIAPNFSNEDAGIAMMIYVADAAGIIDIGLM